LVRNRAAYTWATSVLPMPPSPWIHWMWSR
jgi:hypothetical protein